MAQKKNGKKGNKRKGKKGNKRKGHKLNNTNEITRKKGK